MATPTKYTYNIAEDFPNGIVYVANLSKEISASPILTALSYIENTDTECHIWFKDALSSTEPDDETNLDDIIAAHTGKPTAKTKNVHVDNIVKDSFENLQVTVQPTSGSGVTFITQNMGDVRSWVYSSKPLVNHVMYPDETYESYKLYDSAMSEVASDYFGPIADIEHGHVAREDDFQFNKLFGQPGQPMYIYDVDQKYKVTVKKNDVALVNDTDYEIDYLTGTLYPLDGGGVRTSWTSEDDITISCYYIVDSVQRIYPYNGKLFRIKNVEIQFSASCNLHKQWMIMDTYQTIPGLGSWLVKRRVYKNRKAYLDESNNKTYARIQGSAEINGDIEIFTWDYISANDIRNSAGNFVEVYLVDAETGAKNVPMSTSPSNEPAEMATGTFYCLSVNE